MDFYEKSDLLKTKSHRELADIAVNKKGAHIMELGEGIKKLLLAGIGTAAVTAEKSKEVLDELVKKGELTVEPVSYTHLTLPTTPYV